MKIFIIIINFYFYQTEKYVILHLICAGLTLYKKTCIIYIYIYIYILSSGDNIYMFLKPLRSKLENIFDVL